MRVKKKRLGGYFFLIVTIMLCLLMTSAVCLIMPKNSADAVSSGAQTTDIENILVNNYENKDKKINGAQLDKLYAQITGIANATYKDVLDAAKEIRTSADFRDPKNEQTGGKLITLDFGTDNEGNTLVWNAVYLSINKADEPILTLWLTSSTEKAKWNYHSTAGNASTSLPSNMYSTSMIRTETLNNAGTWYQTNAGGTPHPYIPSADHKYAKFTMTEAQGVNGSLIDFIEKPLNVAWQEGQLSHKHNSYQYDFNNDAWGDVGSGGGDNANWKGEVVNYYGKPGGAKGNLYSEWSNDYLWLPSMAEAGWLSGDATSYVANGMWDTSPAERGNAGNVDSWLRSAREYDYALVKTLLADGSADKSQSTTEDSCAVRPAFHLNLKKAEDSSVRVLGPQDVSKTYTGEELTPEGESWYSVIQAAKDKQYLTEKYYQFGKELTSAPINAGTYTVKYELIENDFFMWSDQSTSGTRTITFTVDKKSLPYPTVSGSSTATYNGGQIPFYFNDYDENAMSIAFKSNYDDVSIADSSALIFSVSAKNAGTYELEATLKDQDNYRWQSQPKMEIKINPAKIVIESIGGSGALESTYGEDKYVDVEIDAINGDGVMKDDVVSLSIYIVFNGKDVILNDPNDSEGIIELRAGVYDAYKNRKLKTGILPQNTTHTLKVKTDNGNYTVEIDGEITLSVMPEGKITNLQWTLKDGKDILERKTVELSDSEDKTFDGEYVYSGREYTVEARYPDTYTLDTSYGNDGYLVEKVSGEGSENGKDAGTYRTSIKLSNGQIYGIVWTIDKAVFDLSGVKWEYGDMELPFTVGGISAVLKEETIPEGLKATYLYESKGYQVGNSVDQEVAFDLEGSYAYNYVKPIKDDGNSYIGEFKWGGTWTVVKAKIEVKWTEEVREIDGITCRVRVLDIEEKYRNLIQYRYYEVNSKDEITEDTPYVRDLSVEANKVKTYIAMAEFSSDNGERYELVGDAYSLKFEIGSYSEEVQITLEKSELTYNGNAQEVAIKVTKGSASASAFEIEYYDRGGVVALESAPSAVGKYTVRIKIKDGIDGYYLSGENVEDGIAVIDYEIKQVEIKGDVWNTQHNPPSLKASASEMKGIRHEYADENGNPISFSDLKPGGKYKVRAVITDKNNYVFADGSTETEWIEFEVGANEQLYDPDDPNNPFYPSDGDNDPSDKDDGNPGFDKAVDMLKQWWQVIVSGLSIALILVFIGKALAYDGKRRKIKKEINERYSTYYAAGLFGLSMTKWTVIAGCLAGGAVLSLILMIISKARYNKAVTELGKSKDESDRKKEEEMKMMFMRMMNGGNMTGGQAQGGYGYAQPSLGAEEMRVMINDAVTAMLPNMQQYLPQQASANDELVQRLMEQNEMLMQKLSEQSAEKQVAATSVDEESIVKIIDKLTEKSRIVEKPVEKIVEVNKSDDRIEQLMRNQEILMRQMEELKSNRPIEKQVVEKVIEVPVEKVVEKIVEKPVEKIIEKQVRVEVPVEVEKIVEKEVKVEVPVEKVVEKVVAVPAAKPAAPKKAVTPRLTLDEAYAKLSKEQKKYFDTLKAYAMSKDKCKEKKSAYFILLGQSSVNPLVKLTIKKDMTVALFKMEDEYFKDIRRNAGSDGTKIKVKETELIVGDAQALDAAKEMIDLREDQIERYQDYIKEQRSLSKK